MAALPASSLFKLNDTGQIAADGRYRVLSLKVEADTRGQPWYQTLTCLATGASANKGQIEAGVVSSDFEGFRLA